MSNGSGGPYLQTAVFCERVLQEKDGVLSAVRIIDRITVAAGAQSPAEMPVLEVKAFLLLMLKSGFARGRYTIRVVPVSPSQTRLHEMSAGILLEGEDRGVNVILNVQLMAKEEGVFWFEVLCEDQLLTRVPLRIVYLRMTQGGLFESS